jgi:hypothetical protein
MGISTNVIPMRILPIGVTSFSKIGSDPLLDNETDFMPDFRAIRFSTL